MLADELRAFLYSRMEELPTLPAVVTRVIALLHDPDVDGGTLAEMIAHDPALAAKVLKVANSAYYGFSSEIDNLRHAVSLLGLTMTKSLAVSIGVMGAVPRAAESPYLSDEGLWRHSAAVAILVSKLARRVKGARAGEHLFVAGLLHDVGKVVLAHFFAERYLSALTLAHGGGGGTLSDAENLVLGVDHAQVAGLLLARWRLPPTIIRPIQDLHAADPGPATDPVDLALLRGANRLALEMELGREGSPLPPPEDPAVWETLAMGEGERAALTDELAGVREEVDSFFRALR